MNFNDIARTFTDMLGPARSSAPPAPAASAGFAIAPRAESAPAPAPTSFTPAPPAGQSSGDLPRVQFSGADAWEFLPSPAREKFLALRDEADDLHSAVDPLREKIGELHIDKLKAEARVARLEQETAGRLDGGDLPGLNSERAKVATLTGEINRLQSRYDVRAREWRAKRVVVTAIETYLRRAGGPFEMAPAVSAPTPSKGENSLDLLLRLRQKVAKLKEDRQAIVDAPVPSADAKRLAVAQIEALAARGAPSCVALVDGSRELQWPSKIRLAEPIVGPDGRVTAFAGRDRTEVDVFGLFAWLHRDALIDRICAEIELVSDDASALSPETRAKKLLQVDTEILALERQEESAIVEALARGYLVERRENADPRAVLGIEGPAPAAAL